MKPFSLCSELVWLEMDLAAAWFLWHREVSSRVVAVDAALTSDSRVLCDACVAEAALFARPERTRHVGELLHLLCCAARLVESNLEVAHQAPAKAAGVNRRCCCCWLSVDCALQLPVLVLAAAT